jgi:hypothetical protein
LKKEWVESISLWRLRWDAGCGRAVMVGVSGCVEQALANMSATARINVEYLVRTI